MILVKHSQLRFAVEEVISLPLWKNPFVYQICVRASIPPTHQRSDEKRTNHRESPPLYVIGWPRYWGPGPAKPANLLTLH